MEISPTGGLQEVDTKQTTTGEATLPTAEEGNSVSCERKVDDVAGLVQAQEKQLGPDVEAGDTQGADETMPAPAEQKEEGPNEAASASPGEHFYQAGDSLIGTVDCINIDGVWLAYGKLQVLIPETENSRYFQIGDTVQAAVNHVESDGTLIMDLDMRLEDDGDGASSSGPRRWKCGWSSQWWGNSWYGGQWDQDSSSYDWNWKEEDRWQCYGWSAEQWIPPDKWEEGVLKQFYGERLYRMLDFLEVYKGYIGKITGVLLERSVDAVKELAMDFGLLKSEAREAYKVLDKWKCGCKLATRKVLPRAVPRCVVRYCPPRAEV